MKLQRILYVYQELTKAVEHIDALDPKLISDTKSEYFAIRAYCMNALRDLEEIDL